MAGSGQKGLVDGPAQDAQLNAPEGICQTVVGTFLYVL
eukprot:SAG31_NODE_468_length_15250_cov_5.304138_2_plen_38_part_00